MNASKTAKQTSGLPFFASFTGGIQFSRNLWVCGRRCRSNQILPFQNPNRQQMKKNAHNVPLFISSTRISRGSGRRRSRLSYWDLINLTGWQATDSKMEDSSCQGTLQEMSLNCVRACQKEKKRLWSSSGLARRTPCAAAKTCSGGSLAPTLRREVCLLRNYCCKHWPTLVYSDIGKMCISRIEDTHRTDEPF